MPCRARDLRRALQTFGVTVDKPKKGSHWKAIRGAIVYPVPLHNGLKTELDDAYIRGVCRAFDIDEAELRALL